MSDKYKPLTNELPQTTVAAVGYTSISIVSAELFTRISLFFYRPRKPAAEDYLVFFACVSFIAQCSLYIAIAPLSDRVLGVQDGKVPYYDVLLQD